MKFAVFALAAAVLVSGCAYNASPYGVSPKNVDLIKVSGIKPIAVSSFTSSKPGLNSITCRAAGPVTVSPSFESYIEKALIEELRLAGVYNPNATTKLSGKLNEVDFSSGMTDGKWSFSVTIANDRDESFTTSSTYRFSGSFVADRACQEVAQAFQPAVHQLIEDIVLNSKFKQLAR